MIAEPDVTLTDWGLAVECAVLSRMIARDGGPRPHALARPWLALFFASTAVAALLGGMVHGLFPGTTAVGRLLWPTTILAIGVTAWAAWAAGGHLAFGPKVGRAIARLAGVGFVAYAVVAWRGGFAFAVAIAGYLPAAAFLLGVFAWRYRTSHDRRLLAGVAGIGLTFVAAAVQQARVSLSAAYFDYNALYHVIQAVALWLIYRGAARALAPPA